MNDEQLLRYSRHILLEDFDYHRQQQLLESKVLIVGLGGLGCPVALYLAAAGVGELWLADFDTIDISNLQRQIAYGMPDINRKKVLSASERIALLNPDVNLVMLADKVAGKALYDAVAQVDIVVDASDNFSTRFDVNRACIALNKPLVSGAAMRAEGQVAVFDRRNTQSPCYACLFDNSLIKNQHTLDSCAENGVLAPLVGVIGSLQALETLKLLSHFGETSSGYLFIFDGKTTQWEKRRIKKDPFCEACKTY